MPRKYIPVSVKPMQWALVYKHILEYKNKGVSKYELAEKLNVAVDDLSFEKALQQLQQQGRVRVIVGGTKEYPLCTMLQAILDQDVRDPRVEKVEKKDEIKGETYEGID